MTTASDQFVVITVHRRIVIPYGPFLDQSQAADDARVITDVRPQTPVRYARLLPPKPDPARTLTFPAKKYVCTVNPSLGNHITFCLHPDQQRPDRRDLGDQHPDYRADEPAVVWAMATGALPWLYATVGPFDSQAQAQTWISTFDSSIGREWTTPPLLMALPIRDRDRLRESPGRNIPGSRPEAPIVTDRLSGTSSGTGPESTTDTGAEATTWTAGTSTGPDTGPCPRCGYQSTINDLAWSHRSSRRRTAPQPAPGDPRH